MVAPPGWACAGGANETRTISRASNRRMGGLYAAPARAGDGGTVHRGDPPFLLHADVDADAAAPRDASLRILLIFDAERAGREIEQVLLQIDSERLRQVARAAAQFVDVELRGPLDAV